MGIWRRRVGGTSSIEVLAGLDWFIMRGFDVLGWRGRWVLWRAELWVWWEGRGGVAFNIDGLTGWLVSD